MTVLNKTVVTIHEIDIKGFIVKVEQVTDEENGIGFYLVTLNYPKGHGVIRDEQGFHTKEDALTKALHLVSLVVNYKVKL